MLFPEHSLLEWRFRDLQQEEAGQHRLCHARRGLPLSRGKCGVEVRKLGLQTCFAHERELG
jgi:hypothetical protein